MRLRINLVVSPSFNSFTNSLHYQQYSLHYRLSWRAVAQQATNRSPPLPGVLVQHHQPQYPRQPPRRTYQSLVQPRTR